MTVVADHRLPGITYEVVPPRLPDTLPRMDVAGFVGFASTGPVDVPVVIDDVAGLREVFGPDVRLAREPDEGAWRHAHLAPVVEEYLRNGGRRCWVVRVAAPQAQAARFAPPGLLHVAAGDADWRTGQLAARAVGDWADDLMVATALRSSRLPPVVGVADDAPRLRVAARTSLQPGDLLRATLDGGARTVLLVVAAVEPAADGTSLVTWDRQLVLDADPDEVAVTGPAVLITPDGEQDLGASVTATSTGTPGERQLDLDPSAARAGSTIRLALAEGRLVGPVRAAAPGAAGVTVGPCQRVADVPVVAAGDAASTALPGDARPVLERLTLSLAVYRDERLHARVDGLGFDTRHPEPWTALPTDEQLFTVRGRAAGADGRGPRPPGSSDAQLPPLWDRVSSPRFPLAGTAPTDVATWFPVAVADAASPQAALATVSDTSPTARRERSGLATFDPDVFLDPQLRSVPPDGLRARVDARASERDPSPLRGLHGLFPIDEVTLAAAPDASHPGWRVVTEERDPPPAAPELTDPQHDDGLVLWWSRSPGVARYVLQEAASLELADPVVRLDGQAPLDAGPDGTVGIRLEAGSCPSLRAFRVRAVADDGRSSPWSNTVHAIDPPTAFLGEEPHLPAPVLELEHEPPDAAEGPDALAERLAWTRPDDAGLGPDVRVELAWSRDPVFATADRHDPGDDDHLDLQPAGQHHAFHRARYRDDSTDRVGPWSRTVVQRAADRELLELLAPAPDTVDAPLVDLQRALLRFAAARGDVLAVLSLPAHYRGRETVQHLSRLRGIEVAGGVAGGDDGDGPIAGGPAGRRLLDNGAVIAPWTVVRTAGGLQEVPPDGAFAGIVAHRTLERGAWISPANQPLGGVVALGREPHGVDRGELAAAGVNLLLRRPNGVVATSATTLGEDPTTRPIEVRRLLHLLRRLALRHGTTYVFEPHGHRFRSMVRRTFQRLLADLYERGAFAGASPSEGYQVVADRSINPPESVDAGRFVVELRVAPTQPMAFVRVRLVQTGPGDAVAVEVPS